MNIGIQGKLNELSGCQKTDGTIQAEYNQKSIEYKQIRTIYKSSKEEYVEAQKQLEKAQKVFADAPLTQMFRANKQVKAAKKNLKQKKQKFRTDRENFKKKLKELRGLKNEIRSQYKSHRQYTKFFKKVQEAQKMGIELPKYITDEYAKQKTMYLSEKYTVDKNGKRSYITQPNNACYKDVSTLITEKSQENIKEKMQNIATQAKDYFVSPDEGR